VVGALAANGWHPGRTLGLVLGALSVLVVTDATQLYVLTAHPDVSRPTIATGWPAAAVLLAFAAWQERDSRTTVRIDDPLLLAVPTFFAAVSLGVLVVDHFTHIFGLAAVLAWAALLAVIVRMALT